LWTCYYKRWTPAKVVINYYMTPRAEDMNASSIACLLTEGKT